MGYFGAFCWSRKYTFSLKKEKPPYSEFFLQTPTMGSRALLLIHRPKCYIRTYTHFVLQMEVGGLMSKPTRN
jgi:hypothetical protein